MLVRPLVIVLAPTGRSPAAPPVLALPTALPGWSVVRSSASLSSVFPSTLALPSVLTLTSISTLRSILLPVAILCGPGVSRTLVGLPGLLAGLFRPLPSLAVSSIGSPLTSLWAVDALGWRGLVLSRPVIAAALPALPCLSALAAALGIGIPFSTTVLLTPAGFPILLVTSVLAGTCLVGTSLVGTGLVSGMLSSSFAFSMPRTPLLTGSLRSRSLPSSGARFPPVAGVRSLPSALVALGSLAPRLAVLPVAALPAVSSIPSLVAPVLPLPASGSPFDRSARFGSAGSPWLLGLSWDVRVHCGSVPDRYSARATSPIGVLCPFDTVTSPEKRPLHAPDGATWRSWRRGRRRQGRAVEIGRRREIAPGGRAPRSDPV